MKNTLHATTPYAIIDAMKPLTKITLLIITSLFFLGCSGKDVTVDYDTQTNPATLNSFTIKANNSALDPINAARFKTALQDVLQAKGYRYNAEAPVFTVTYATRIVRDAPSNTSVSVGLGGGSYGRGVSLGASKRLTHDEAHFVISMQREHAVFWSANMKSRVDTKSTPEQKADYIHNAVERMLESYPEANP